MKTHAFLILAAGLLVAADNPGKESRPMNDLDRLRGTWVTVSLVNDGKTLVDEKTPPNEGPATKLVYEGNVWRIQVGDKTVASGKFAIDATKAAASRSR